MCTFNCEAFATNSPKAKTSCLKQVGAIVLAFALGAAPGFGVEWKPCLDDLAGQPVDIASSAYPYRADRKPDENPPESWIALMQYAGMPLSKPLDLNAPAIKQALCALLWEEIRPIQRLELTWAADAKNLPAPEDLIFTTLDNQGSASSWWNNLRAEQKAVKPAVSADGRTYVCDLRADTCGIVLSVGGQKAAAEYDVPTVRVLVADTWKRMEIEIEWGFEPSAAGKDYGGRIEAYDGVVAGMAPLDGDKVTRTTTTTSSWISEGKGGSRRGIKASLLYMGTSKWRKVTPFTSQRDDVARTIVTVWTKSGNFSFLASDLEKGPILAPEYGFFVRATKLSPTAADGVALDETNSRKLLTNKLTDLLGNEDIRGWISDGDTPWFAANATDKPATVSGITVPSRGVATHPGADCDAGIGWRSPVDGRVTLEGNVADAQPGGDDRAFPGHRRQGVDQGQHAAHQGQRRLDPAAAAGGLADRSRR